MGAEFAGKPVVDPRDVLRACRELRLPTEDWAGLPTSFRTSTRVPGYGYILLARKDLNAIPETESHSMKFEHNGKSLTFKKVWIKETRCLTPSFEKDEESVYLCTIVDYRRFMRSIPANAIYNLRDASGNLNTASLNSSSQWTWAGMLGNLWAKSSELGTFPGLPSGLSPHGNPNHFDYSTWSLWDAILHTCDRLGLAFVYDPFADKYSLTRVGSSSPRWPTPSSFVWDDYVLAGDNANEPNEIKTQFRRLPVASSGEPTFTKTVSRTGKTGILAGSAVLLADDLTASVSTDSALTSRANDRAAEWERIKPTDYAKGTLTIFVGLHDLTASHLGKRIESVAWVDRGCDSTDFSDSGGGWTTEAKAGSIGFYEEWRPTALPASGGGGAAPCTPNYVLNQFISKMDCDTFGSNLISDFGFRVDSTGCTDDTNLYWITVSGKVIDSGGAGVNGVAIVGSDADPNLQPPAPNYVTIATTGADGTFSGKARMIIDATTNPTPGFYVSLKASGYSPSEYKFYNVNGPITTANFAP